MPPNVPPLEPPAAWTWIATADGSFTAAFSEASEPMHSRAGAIAETLYVYGPATEFAFAGEAAVRCLSVGLGLGYCEMLVAASAIHRRREFCLDSLEAEPALARSLLAWVEGQPRLAQRWGEVYTEGARQIGAAHGVSGETIRETLRAAYRAGAWRLLGPLGAESKTRAYAAIFYDLFSAKTDGPLWEETFLAGWLPEVAAERCAFATYAARAGKRRALRGAGFRVEPRAGFGFKRECTLALRG